MSGLGQYLEEDGIATVQISLIREHTAAMAPPRALWVAYELGRPLGAPDDPALQRRILGAALSLLQAESGPVLVDFPEQPAATGDGEDAWVCPISLPPPAVDAAGGGFRAALAAEIGLLLPWFDQAVRQRGHSTVGASGIDIEALPAFLTAWLDGEMPASPNPDLTPAQALNQTAHDLKQFYNTAAMAQPGRRQASSSELKDWFWGETVAGQVVLRLKQCLYDHPDKDLKLVARVLLVPRGQVHHLEALPPLGISASPSPATADR